eukprot:scaffold15221_cov35-Phaeocystis_antarctica.AAC.1
MPTGIEVRVNASGHAAARVRRLRALVASDLVARKGGRDAASRDRPPTHEMYLEHGTSPAIGC